MNGAWARDSCYAEFAAHIKEEAGLVPDGRFNLLDRTGFRLGLWMCPLPRG